MFSVSNEHYLTEAINKGQSVILFSAHFMPLMLGGRALLLKHNIANIYRPQNNTLFDEVMCTSFVKNGAIMIKTQDTRSMLKAIKNKIPIWYAPDQDLGLKKSVFAPFFNIQTATVSATARIAKGKNTVVIPYFFNRNKSGYQMEFQPPIKNYPDKNDHINAKITNEILEQQILKYPEQYLWIHRRFKTRPQGEQKFY
jgi:lauroyl/myristoyl acyltransferase